MLSAEQKEILRQARLRLGHRSRAAGDFIGIETPGSGNDVMVLRSAAEILADMKFEPLVEAVNLYRRALNEEKWKEARLVLHDIMEFTMPKSKAIDHTHTIKSVQVVYADEIDALPPPEPPIKADDNDPT